MKKFRFWACAGVLAFASILASSDGASAHDWPEKPGRWVDAGPWNGLLDCESSPTSWGGGPLVPQHHSKKHRREVRIDQQGLSGDRGAFQFIQPTWNSVAIHRGQSALMGRDPREFTLARQLKQAQWLSENVGIWQWTCGYRYGDGTGPVYVTGEDHLPKNPERCSNRLVARHNIRRIHADSICGVGEFEDVQSLRALQRLSR